MFRKMTYFRMSFLTVFSLRKVEEERDEDGDERGCDRTELIQTQAQRRHTERDSKHDRQLGNWRN